MDTKEKPLCEYCRRGDDAFNRYDAVNDRYDADTANTVREWMTLSTAMMLPTDMMPTPL